jgi:rhamnogalacturonyl hydrolase YesR
MKNQILILFIGCLFIFSGCHKVKHESDFASYAMTLMDSTLMYYKVPGQVLFYETYPKRDADLVTYLAGADTIRKNRVAYLWPTSGMFSALNALQKTTGDKKYENMIESVILPGLECYFDSLRVPGCYQSYLTESGKSDRFYDDNLWLGLDFLDLYEQTGNDAYLASARNIWSFIESGCDSILGGGVYWCEQKKESKNTCSNAPGSVLALKLFKATNDSIYFRQGKELYEWTQKNLQDSTDYLYFDNIGLDRKIGKAKYAYNSGQMMQSAALLYQLTRNPLYLKDAQNIAKECYNYFFTDFTTTTGESFKMLKQGDIWFTAVMLRGFIELYHIDKNKTYINAFDKSLNHAWMYARDDKGLFNTDLSGKSKDDKKWLLTQAAMIEMYARLATIQ